MMGTARFRPVEHQDQWGVAKLQQGFISHTENGSSGGITLARSCFSLGASVG